MISRRRFLANGAAAAAGAAAGPAILSAAARQQRPNILWIFGDDLGCELSCYGHPVVQTPNLDRLAEQGTRYANCFTSAPVCSPSRSALITGMYATSIGAHHHRSHRDDGYRPPAPVKVICDYFRETGYFTANVTTPAPGLKCGGKTDFNFNPQKIFDGTDWNQRKASQPFYAQINFSEPHRGAAASPWGAARKLARQLIDPSKVVVPPCYPDHPVIRSDWAGYLDSIQVLDDKVGRVIARLEQEKLAESTIVIFVGDNGRCHIRDKQFLYDGGIHVPLIIRAPGITKAGAVSEDLISGIDLPAVSLALAGIELPAHMQGRAFLGPKAARPREYIFAHRDRCDETTDRIRCVRNKRYKYIRNFMPDRPCMQANKYKEQSYPAWNLMKELKAQGKLTAEQAAFVADRRPEEELYDVQADPHELRNLSGSEGHRQTLLTMRAELEKWIKDTKDQGQTPEEKTG